ncbi:MAG TPA: NAD(P)H:quinone oxidoreductase [Rhabdochlamydiaceae bacterium]|nr:NAD(P)H:quinone oxidoreductase [Rhabdochlamydiaceae bacterium]
MKIHIVFYSMYGHIYKMAQAVAEGAKKVEGAQVTLLQVKETLSEDILKKMGALEAKKAFADVPFAEISMLPEADAIIFGTPTRFGNMCAQMRTLLDAAGKLWKQNSLVGKIGSVFTSTGTQHGGQETTITSFHTTLFHLGMIVVGVPYSCPEMTNMKEITGGTPYGASTMAGDDGARMPTGNELAIARFQGEHVAKIAKKLAR